MSLHIGAHSGFGSRFLRRPSGIQVTLVRCDNILDQSKHEKAKNDGSDSEDHVFDRPLPAVITHNTVFEHIVISFLRRIFAAPNYASHLQYTKFRNAAFGVRGFAVLTNIV